MSYAYGSQISAQAQIQPQPQSFVDVINYACETHPTIAAANLDVLQANANISVSKSLFLPTIRSISEAGIAEDKEDAGLGVSGTRPYSTQIVLDQPLFTGGRVNAQVKSAKLTRDSLRYQGISQVIDIQSRAILAYIQLGQALTILGVRQENLEALEQQRDDAKRRYELGGGTKSNIAEVEARIFRAQGNLVAAKSDVDESRILLGEASGTYVKGDVTVPLIANIPDDYYESVNIALSKNPQIKAADQQIDIAQAAVDVAKSDRLPQVRLIGELNAQRDTSFFGFERDEARLRLRLDIPIFEGGRLAAQEKASIHQATRTKYDRVALTRVIIEQIQREWNNLQEAKKLVEVNQSLEKSNEQALEAIKREAFEGFRPNRDVLDAQQELLEARLSLQQSRFALTEASYRLQFSIGEIDEIRFPSCSNAVISPDTVAEKKDVTSRRIELPIIGDVIGSEKGRRRRGPPNRR